MGRHPSGYNVTFLVNLAKTSHLSPVNGPFDRSNLTKIGLELEQHHTETKRQNNDSQSHCDT